MYPEAAQRGAELRSAPIKPKLNVRVRKRVVPLGFCSGGFSSTAGYVPGNEAYVRRHKRHSSQTAVPFRRVPLVFIRAASAERPEGRCLAKPFGFDLRRYSTVDPLDVLSNLTSPLSSLSSGRSKARKHFDYGCILHPKKAKSSRKYFKFGAFLASRKRARCGKFRGAAVDKTVEKFRGPIGTSRRWRRGVKRPEQACGNRPGKGLKKNFRPRKKRARHRGSRWRDSKN